MLHFVSFSAAGEPSPSGKVPTLPLSSVTVKPGRERKSEPSCEEKKEASSEEEKEEGRLAQDKKFLEFTDHYKEMTSNGRADLRTTPSMLALLDAAQDKEKPFVRTAEVADRIIRRRRRKGYEIPTQIPLPDDFAAQIPLPVGTHIMSQFETYPDYLSSRLPINSPPFAWQATPARHYISSYYASCVARSYVPRRSRERFTWTSRIPAVYARSRRCDSLLLLSAHDYCDDQIRW